MRLKGMCWRPASHVRAYARWYEEGGYFWRSEDGEVWWVIPVPVKTLEVAS